MAKKKLPPGYYDPADYVMVHERHLRRLQRGYQEVSDELAQRIAARLGRADAWRDVLDAMQEAQMGSAEAEALAVGLEDVAAGRIVPLSSVESPPKADAVDPQGGISND